MSVARVGATQPSQVVWSLADLRREFDTGNHHACVLQGLEPQHRVPRLDAVERGLPKATLRHVARRVFSDAGEQRAMMHRIVPEATYKRRRERLSPAESERTERLARVVAMAEEVWQDREQARRFLTSPHPEIGGKTPLEAALTELGARQAEEVMVRIVYGLPA